MCAQSVNVFKLFAHKTLYFAIFLCYNTVMKVKVFAKLNLSLNVGARQGEFHPIDSVVTSVNIFDVVTVTLRQDESISVICNNADIPTLQNSAYRAAVEFQKEFGIRGCSINIVKNIPMGAGMGGSSADAAAVVYCLCALCGVSLEDERVRALCARIGSDVNFMLRGGLAQITGKGDEVECFALRKPLYFALTTFSQQMSTKEVYAAFDNLSQRDSDLCNNRRLLCALTSDVPNNTKGATIKPTLSFSNMLQPAAMSLSSYAVPYLQFCAANGLFPTMTGSGSAFYVACYSQKQATEVAELLNSQCFVTRVCKTVPHGIQKVR